MAEDNKNSFVVYTGIKETLDALTDEEVAALFRGMVDYQITGKDPKLSGSLKLAFIPIRQQMDRDNTKWQQTKEARKESGRKGGIESGKSRRRSNEANEANASVLNASDSNVLKGVSDEASKQMKQTKQNEANEAVNVNVNVNVNEDVDVNESDTGSDASSLSSSLIEYLNSKSGGKYKPTKDITSRIDELLAAGYTETDMRAVIDKKLAEWKDDPKMRSYLRPRTLFGDKFEEYVSAPDPVEVQEERQREEVREKLIEERKSAQAALSVLTGSIQSLREKPGGIRANWAHYRTLADEKAVCEQQLSNIDLKLGRLGYDGS